MPNGSKFFEHYLYGKGKSLYYNYNYAINYDKGIRNTIEYEIMTMAGYVEKNKAKTDYWIIGSNYFAVYPSTLDWMFSLGTHLALIIGQVFFNQKTSEYEVCVMIEAYDLYNFSKTKKFLGVKVKTPGRFQELGWANAYESFGFAMYKVTWKAGFYMSTNKRIDCTPYIK